MKNFGKIAGFNLLAILAYSGVIRLITLGDQMAIAIMSAFAVGIHVVISLAVAGVSAGNGEKERARAWLLASLVVLLVGFSTCLGNASL